MENILEFNFQLNRNGFIFNMQAEVGNGITGIFGPSGHGKTTLLNVIAGLVKPESGKIKMRGRSIFSSFQKIDCPVNQRRIGYVFQDIRLFPHLNVSKNLRYGINKKESGNIQEAHLFEVLQINDLLKKKPSECSGGEKQRIAIGRALLSGAQILLMDEPFSAVDIKLRSNILPFLKAINSQFNIPMLIISHDLTDLLSLTNNLLLVKDGCVSDFGMLQNLFLKESNLDILKAEGFYNAFNMYVFATLPGLNMVLLKNNSVDFQVQVLSQHFFDKVEIGRKMKVLIRSEDITVSLQPVENISLRNQIRGTIVKIFTKNGLSFCIVDSGEKMVVEITEASRRIMNLTVGKIVYCLFKSAAVKIF